MALLVASLESWRVLLPVLPLRLKHARRLRFARPLLPQAEQVEAFRALEAAEHHLKQVEAMVGPSPHAPPARAAAATAGATGGAAPVAAAAGGGGDAASVLLVEAQTEVQAAAAAAGDASERLSAALAERDALQGELRALQRRLEAAPLARRDERLLGQLKVGWGVIGLLVVGEQRGGGVRRSFVLQRTT